MFDLSRFIDACQNALETPKPEQTICEIMSEAAAHPASIETALRPGGATAGECAQYHFLYQSSDLTILNVIMPGHLPSPPHNHLIWAVIGIYGGRENNVFYRREGDRVVEAGRRNLVAPEVMVLTPDTIHGISNPLAQRSYALHVYGGRLANPARSLWNPFTLQEELFKLSALLNYEREMIQGAAKSQNKN